MKNYFYGALLLCSAVLFAYGDQILTVNYSMANQLLQNGAIIHPDASKTTDPIQCFDMGTTGLIEIPNIALPQGPFSIESEFYLRGYNETDPDISGVFEGFNCDYGNTGAGNTEGVEFRVGGGYNYPLKIQDVYNNVSDWVPPDDSAKTARAAISLAIGEFGLGVGQHIWKEIYTNSCIETNTWMHMVATWDGTTMLVYLNGRDATDNWRTTGAQLPVLIANVRTVYVGAQDATAARHVNGKIGFVNVYNEVLSPGDVWNKFRQSAGGNICARFIEIESPRCGEVISPDTKIKFSVRDSLGNDVTPSGKSYSVHICREPTFSDPSAKTYQTAVTACGLKDLVGADTINLSGLFYFRITDGPASALSKRADDAPVAQSGTLPAYLISSSTKIAPHAGLVHKGTANIGQLANQVIYDIRGRTMGIGSKVPLSTLQNGIYFVKTGAMAGQKILFVK